MSAAYSADMSTGQVSQSLIQEQELAQDAQYQEDQPTMPEFDASRPLLETLMDGVKPSFVDYWDPKNDKVALAIQQAEERLRTPGKPLVND